MRVHGVLLTGGSLFGLEAASGIKRYLAERGVGERLAPGLPSIPIVVGAVVFDLPIGRPNHPDRDSGYRAARNARAGGVEQGSVGVGPAAPSARPARAASQPKAASAPPPHITTPA